MVFIFAAAIGEVISTISGWFNPLVLDLDGDGIELTGMGQTGAALRLFEQARALYANLMKAGVA